MLCCSHDSNTSNPLVHLAVIVHFGVVHLRQVLFRMSPLAQPRTPTYVPGRVSGSVVLTLLHTTYCHLIWLLGYAVNVLQQEVLPGLGGGIVSQDLIPGEEKRGCTPTCCLSLSPCFFFTLHLQLWELRFSGRSDDLSNN